MLIPAACQGATANQLTCPITHDLVRIPVRLQGDAHNVYEEQAACQWLSVRRSNPMTREPLHYLQPLQRDMGAADNAFALRLQIARSQQLSDPKAAAARTIQAAWFHHRARRVPIQPPRFSDAAQAEATSAWVRASSADLSARIARRSARGQAHRAESAAVAADHMAAQARACPPLHQVVVSWEAVAEAATLGLASALQASLTTASGPTLHEVAQRCTEEGQSLHAMLLADNAGPLRFLIDQGAFDTLRSCSTWIGRGIYADGRLAFDVSHGFGRYWGEFHGSQVEGRGIIVNSDGSSGYGNFDFGQPNGQFCMVDAEGLTIQAGTFLEGHPVDLGRAEFGIPFSGHWAVPQGDESVMDRPLSGLGVLHQDDTRLAGVVAAGRFFCGRATFASGTVAEGILDASTDVRLGTLSFTNHTTYFGEYSGEQASGHGTLHEPDGEMLGGQWTEGRLDGPGYVGRGLEVTLGRHGPAGFEAWCPLRITTEIASAMDHLAFEEQIGHMQSLL